MSRGAALERLTAALVSAGCSVRGGKAQCPAHEDRMPSLSITQAEDKVLVKCHRECTTDAVLEALGLSAADLFDEPRQRGSGRQVIARYEYCDEAGIPLFYSVRYFPKSFSQYRIVNGREVKNLQGVRRVIYRLPQVLAAVKAGRRIFLCEGEKDVGAIEAAGEVGTCNPMGAGGGWRPEYSDSLAGADVIIVADKDDQGRKHAERAAKSLKSKARSVRIVEAAEGKDAADHLAAGHGVDDFRPVSSDTEREEPADELGIIAAQYSPVDWEAAWKGQPEEIRWLIEPVIEEATINSLFARPGTGKSLIALEWALRLVREGRTVVYIDDENRLTDVVERLQAFGAEPAELGRLLLYSFAGLPPLDTPAGGTHLLALAVTSGASLVVLDTTSRMVAGGENDSDTFLGLYRHSMKPLKSRGVTVLRLDHPGKDGERGQRGSSAKEGDVDTIWRLSEVTQGRTYRLHREKSRSGHGGDGDIEVQRRYSPLCHVLSVRDSRPENTPLGQVCGQLSALGVPPSAGRDRCRTALSKAGIQVGNDLLTEVVRHRKYGCNCPGQVADRSDSQSPGGQLSGIPPLSREGDSGQVAVTRPPEPWPEGSFGRAANY